MASSSEYKSVTDCADMFIPAKVVFVFMVILTVTSVPDDLVPEVTCIGGVLGNLSVAETGWEINNEGFVPAADSIGFTGIPKRKRHISLHGKEK